MYFYMHQCMPILSKYHKFLHTHTHTQFYIYIYIVYDWHRFWDDVVNNVIDLNQCHITWDVKFGIWNLRVKHYSYRNIIRNQEEEKEKGRKYRKKGRKTETVNREEDHLSIQYKAL